MKNGKSGCGCGPGSQSRGQAASKLNEDQRDEIRRRIEQLRGAATDERRFDAIPLSASRGGAFPFATTDAPANAVNLTRVRVPGPNGTTLNPW